MDNDARRLLAVFAHPDDESFMAGGTLALYAERGWDIRVVCATSGEGGRRGSYESLSLSEFAAVRRAELMSACQALRIPSPTFLHASDGAVGQKIADLEKRVVAILRRFRPHVVITFGPDGISGHADHRAVHAVVSGAFAEWLHATRSRPDAAWPRLYYVLRSAAVPACCDRHGPPAPTRTTVINIERVGRRKLAAIRSHCSQGYLHPVTEAGIRVAATSPEYFHRAYPVWPENCVELETSLDDDTTRFTDRTEDTHSSSSAGDRPVGAVQP